MKNTVSMFALLLMAVFATTAAGQLNQQPLTDVELRERIFRSIKLGTTWLKSRQSGNGSWNDSAAGVSAYPIGQTALGVLALINCDEPVDSRAVQNGLTYLRGLPSNKPNGVYETSVLISALCAADDFRRDRTQLVRLVDLLERTQCTSGINSGSWGYKLVGRGGTPGQNGEDRSNAQFAILALRDAAYAGIRVDRAVWKRAYSHFLNSQNANGGWAYRNGGGSNSGVSGSMTAAGLSSLAITSRMLDDDSDVDADGKPDCCVDHPPAQAFQNGRRWLATNFRISSNPGAPSQHLYYLYGLERAARLGHVRFFGRHDWYREGATYLQAAQRGDGSWFEGSYGGVVPTTFALLFLSKGLSRVVVNKLDYTSGVDSEDSSGDWNRHPLDVPNLIEKIDGLKGWPSRLTSQNLKLSRLDEENAVTRLNQAPVLFIGGREQLPLTAKHAEWLRNYIDEGGFIFASANCSSDEFNKSFRQLVQKMFPQGEASLQRLGSDHPVFRSEFRLPSAESVELYGVDFGCRTAIIFSPDDLGCLWQKWMKHDPLKRNEALIQRIFRSTSIGVNVLAYATGREPPVKLDVKDPSQNNSTNEIDRSLLEIAQLRYQGNWDIAPKALKNLLQGLNEAAGIDALPQRKTIPITLSELKKYPVVYMHGRYRFRLADQERDSLRDYLSRGAVLFADACCGSPRFDEGFRDLMKKMFPDNELKQIPVDHEIFQDAVGYQINQVKLRELVPSSQNAALRKTVKSIPPFLEGIEVDGRYVVIYSRYDISCALENQASLACNGYEEADAMKIAINVILYSMLQEISGDSPTPTQQP
ncbi:MAG: DUF4159 domain-containing protein [Fuerstiella sp.]